MRINKVAGIISIIVAVLILQEMTACGSEIITYSASASEPVTETSKMSNESIDALEGRDNTIDPYTSIVHELFKPSAPDNDLGGGMGYGLAESYAFLLKKHAIKNGNKIDTLDDLIVIDNTGAITVKQYDSEHQVWAVGCCADESLKLTVSPQNGTFYIYITDIDGKAVSTSDISALDEDYLERFYPYDIALDKDYIIHLYGQGMGEDSRLTYYIINLTGEIISKYELNEYLPGGFSLMSDGRVALSVTDSHGIGQKYENETLRWVSLDNNGLTELFSVNRDSVKESDMIIYPCGDGKLIYANRQGIYTCNEDLGQKELLYLFSNHGIRVDAIEAIRPQHDGIGVIYSEGGKYSYIYTEPVEQEVDLLQISLAVSSVNRKMYRSAVTAFNKMYPACNIQLEEYDDPTILQTKLIAGSGPVLIDTLLTGFEENIKLWEPLDSVLEDEGLYDQLNTYALEFGIIGGQIYGINTSFTINTLVVGKEEYENWNYDDFLSALKKNDYQNISNSESFESDAMKILSYCFIHGFDDNYFIDKEKNETVFATQDFKDLVDAIKHKQSKKEYIRPGYDIFTGNVLLNQISVSKIEELAAYMSVYGDKAIFAGYPFKDGAHGLISCRQPLAVRKNATVEEKELALTFLKFLLSYDCQMEMIDDVNFGFSIREDVIRHQIETADLEKPVYLPGFDQVPVKEDLSKEQVTQMFNEILADSRPNRTFPKALNQIIAEEMEEYLNDRIDVEQLSVRLNNRINIYLNE